MGIPIHVVHIVTQWLYRVSSKVHIFYLVCYSQANKGNGKCVVLWIVHIWRTADINETESYGGLSEREKEPLKRKDWVKGGNISISANEEKTKRVKCSIEYTNK